MQNAIPAMPAIPATIVVGPEPIFVICPHCQAHIRTVVSRETASTAYVCCGILMLLGLCVFAWIPFCMDKYSTVVHHCPQCKAFIGRYACV